MTDIPVPRCENGVKRVDYSRPGRHPSAQHSCYIGEYGEVTLVLSNLSIRSDRKSGVIMRSAARSLLTPLGEWEALFPSTQGKPPSLSPGPLLFATAGPGV